jgi:ribosomal protein S12 methylthiotransferase accessory factor YcaO
VSCDAELFEDEPADVFAQALLLPPEIRARTRVWVAQEHLQANDEGYICLHAAMRRVTSASMLP